MARRSRAAMDQSAKEMAMAVSIAERAALEIKSALKEAIEPINYTLSVLPAIAKVHAMTKANWRMISLSNGHELFWNGEVRHSTRGKLLFQFEPEMNSELEAREVSMVEIPHDELADIIGAEFEIWLCEEIGVGGFDDLFAQAKRMVDPQDIARAQAEAEAEKARAEEAKLEAARKKLESHPDFGAWA